MTTDENKALIRNVFDQLGKGNTAPYLDMLSEDVTWKVIGTTRWSGTYNGKADVVQKLLRPVSQLMSGTYQASLTRLVAEGDLLVVEFKGNNTTKAGKRYDNEYCWVCRVRDGKVCEVTEYADTELFTSALLVAD